jgi:hypothetical protein
VRQALGERSASGCGSVVFRTLLKGSGNPVSLGSLDSLRGLAVLVVVIVSAIVSVDLECVE